MRGSIFINHINQVNHINHSSDNSRSHHRHPRIHTRINLFRKRNQNTSTHVNRSFIPSRVSIREHSNTLNTRANLYRCRALLLYRHRFIRLWNIQSVFSKQLLHKPLNPLKNHICLPILLIGRAEELIEAPELHFRRAEELIEAPELHFLRPLFNFLQATFAFEVTPFNFRFITKDFHPQLFSIEIIPIHFLPTPAHFERRI